MRRSLWAPVAIGAFALGAYWLISFRAEPISADFFLLADAFLHGRTWIDAVGPWDRIDIDGRTYLPFAPLPALVFMPLVALFGVPATASAQPFINAALAGTCVALGYAVIRRFDGGVLRDRLWVTALFAFSTPLLTITVRGGPWHQGQLLATICSLAAILEASGPRRGLLLGLLGGAGFLARAPVLLALPLYTWAAGAAATVGDARPSARRLVRAAALVAAGAAPAVAFSLWYNAARFGSVSESGYGLAALPPFLEVLREQGLFSLVHVPRNLDYFLWHLPVIGGPPLYLHPDGLGLSVLLTSPGLLIGLRARNLDRFLVGCGLTAVVVFVPSLLYYGGGWVQVGFRYFLDAIPFLLPLIAAGTRTGLGVRWKLLIAAGIAVNLWTVPWLYGF